MYIYFMYMRVVG